MKGKQRKMAKRREKGDGSIYQRASDNMYVAYARVPDTNKKKYVYAKTRTEIVKKLKELQKNIDQGTQIDAKSETVQEYLLYWLEVHSAKIKEATTISYRTHIQTCFPHIGNIKLTKLGGSHLQKMYTILLKDHKTSTIRVLHSILIRAFKDAMRWKHLARNPSLEVDAPRNNATETRPILNGEQAITLLQAAQGTTIECFLVMALTTGMRRGEMLALRWDDIDMEVKILSIQRTASYIKTRTGRYGYIETSPKTKTSKRSVVLTQFLISALKAQKRKQNEARLQAGSNWENKDLVFCTPLGEHFPVGQLTTHFKKLLQENNLPQLHIHDLRHSTSTLLAKMGVPAKVIQEILGHSSIVITQNLYGHVIAGMQEEAMQKMDTIFRKEDNG
jgi:integrase